MQNTKDNILKALVYEQAAHYNYKKFAEEAKKESLPEVAEELMKLAAEEKEHKNRLLNLLKTVLPKELNRGRRMTIGKFKPLYKKSNVKENGNLA